MLEFALHNEAKRAAETIFRTRKLSFDTLTVYVDSPNFSVRLDKGLYFLINKTLEIPTTAKVIIWSQNNLLITTKDAYSDVNLKPFRQYLSVKTINYGTEFVPFALKFLKVMPYEQ